MFGQNSCFLEIITAVLPIIHLQNVELNILDLQTVSIYQDIF